MYKYKVCITIAYTYVNDAKILFTCAVSFYITCTYDTTFLIFLM